MNDENLKADALFGDSLIAFTGALLLGKAWQTPEEKIDLFFIFFTYSIPDYTGLILILGLLCLSMVLALVSVTRRLSVWTFQSRLAYTPLLGTLGLAGFVISWASGTPWLARRPVVGARFRTRRLVTRCTPLLQVLSRVVSLDKGWRHEPVELGSGERYD